MGLVVRMRELAPLLLELLGPPQGHLFSHDLLTLRYQDTFPAHTVPVGTVALVAFHFLAFSVISTPGALRVPLSTFGRGCWVGCLQCTVFGIVHSVQ